MMLGALTVVIMLVVGYASWREGLLTAFCTCCNVIISGLIAFDFWEPLADAIDPMVSESFLHGYEDFLCLVLLFLVPLVALRWSTNQLVHRMPDFHTALQHGGSVLLGMVTGYLVSGFLVCVLQTLPWHEQFMGFNPEYDPNATSAGMRRLLPPDRLWLATMHRLSSGRLALEEKNAFDRNGNFELRYARYRRYNDTRDNPLRFEGETPP
jgi:hypothetical protein